MNGMMDRCLSFLLVKSNPSLCLRSEKTWVENVRGPKPEGPELHNCPYLLPKKKKEKKEGKIHVLNCVGIEKRDRR